MNIKEFLENKGYVYWGKDSEEGLYGSLESLKFQKRIQDEDIPVCKLNNRLFINVNYYEVDFGDFTHKNCTISICAENESSDWCDLNIYNLPVEKFKENIDYYESKILMMWETFYDGA